MKCSVCGEHKNSLTPTYSKLIPEIFLSRCSECEEKDREPRYIIILAGRADDADRKALLPYIKDRRYCGKEILAKEILA